MDYENQQMLETMFNAKQTPLLIRKNILECKPLIELIQRSGLDEEFAIDVLSQMILHKRTTVPTMVGLLRQHFKGDHQTTAKALEIAAAKDLVDFDFEREQFVLKYDLDPATQQLMRQYQYLPPMVIPPLEVTKSRGSGYVTIKTDSLILQDNHHEGDICLDSINRFNNIPLSINIELVKTVRNSWKNIDKMKDGETFEDYMKRRKAFERYERDSFYTIALMESMGNQFYLTHKVDKRGRTYAQGYHINYQGNCWNKACVELAHPQLIEG